MSLTPYYPEGAAPRVDDDPQRSLVKIVALLANLAEQEAGDVASVNGRTGVVVLDKADVALSNVDNTSDVNKPISTATQTALDLKADAFTESRTIFVDASGDDSSGAIGNPSKPYLTIGAAYTAAVVATPTASSPVLIKIGAGTFAEDAITRSTANISFKGVGMGVTIISFASGGITNSAANLNIQDLSIIASGTNIGPLYSECTAIAGTTAGGQYVAGTRLQSIEIFNGSVSSSSQALGGFFGDAYDCRISCTNGIAVNLLWGGRIKGSDIAGSLYGIKDMLAYWPQANPFGDHTTPGTSDSNNRIAMLLSCSVQATNTAGIAVHGLSENGVDWIAVVSGEIITNAATPVANPPAVAGCRIFGPQTASSVGAACTGTLTITGSSLWGTTCVSDMHDCYVVGSYLNQYPSAGYVVRKVWAVEFVGNSIVADSGVQTYRWLASTTKFSACYFEGNSTLQFTSTYLPYVEANCTDSTNGPIMPIARTAANPAIRTRELTNHGFDTAALGFMAWFVAGAYAGGFRTYGLSVGGTTGSPKLALNYSSGGAAAGHNALQYDSGQNFTIGPFSTGARQLTIDRTTSNIIADLGNLVFSTSGKGITGTTTNDNAAALNVGETVSSAVAIGSAVALTTATTANVTSISLTAGDWDVSGNVNYSLTGATATAFSAGVTTTSATVPTDGTECYSGVVTTAMTAINGIAMPTKRISLAATTTIYLVAQSTFSLGTETAFGSITARRRR